MSSNVKWIIKSSNAHLCQHNNTTQQHALKAFRVFGFSTLEVVEHAAWNVHSQMFIQRQIFLSKLFAQTINLALILMIRQALPLPPPRISLFLPIKRGSIAVFSMFHFAAPHCFGVLWSIFGFFLLNLLNLFRGDLLENNRAPLQHNNRGTNLPQPSYPSQTWVTSHAWWDDLDTLIFFLLGSNFVIFWYFLWNQRP